MPGRFNLFRIALCAGVSFAALSIASAVDMTPIEKTEELDGVKISSLQFRDGEQMIEFSPPGGWRVAGAGNKLTLIPTTVQKADATIEAGPVKPVPNLTEEFHPKLLEHIRKILPPDALKVEHLRTTPNPIEISGRKTLAFELKYEHLGTSFRTYFMFLDRERDFWTFRLTSRADDYDRVFDPFRESLYSMMGL